MQVMFVCGVSVGASLGVSRPAQAPAGRGLMAQVFEPHMEHGQARQRPGARAQVIREHRGPMIYCSCRREVRPVSTMFQR